MNSTQIVALWILGAALVAAEPASAPRDARLPLPPVSGALQFEPGTSEIGLEDLLLHLARLTGQELAMTAQVQLVLRGTKERLESAEPVPAAEVYTFIEGLAARQGVVIAPITGGTRPILGVQAAGASSREGALDPLVVGVAALPELDLHPALFVRLLLSLKNTDGRQLQTQLRQLLVDNAGITQCVPVGERALILQGRGRDLAGIARLILEADAAAVAAPSAPKQDESAR